MIHGLRCTILLVGALLGAVPGAHAQVAAPGMADAAPTPADPWSEALGLKPCAPSGLGNDYQVGAAPGQLPSLDRVPWERLRGGDTVRVFYRPEPYKGKILLLAQASADAPMRLCGVKGPGGERPVIDGQDAVAPRGMLYGHPVHESRSVLLINRLGSQDWRGYPSYIQVDGLQIRGAHPRHQFTDSEGKRRNYDAFGACVWVERGEHITLADNEITDCSQAIFSRSTPDGDFAVTKQLRIAGNYMHNIGIAGQFLEHITYIQSVGVVYEFNRYGPMREGSGGNAIKDRSVGVVIRYNRIEDGARALDLVEAEDYSETAVANPDYRRTFVYGNQIVKDGRKGTTIHYGGDHPGNEAAYRKGTLYFFHNTVRLTGNDYAVLFQLSTFEERAQVWNNVFWFDEAIPYPTLRAGQDNAPGIASGGAMELGRNWIVARWSDGGPWHKVAGKVTGTERLIKGSRAPMDVETFVPRPGSEVIDAGLPGPSAASAHPVLWQLDAKGQPVRRLQRGAGPDLGAVER